MEKLILEAPPPKQKHLNNSFVWYQKHKSHRNHCFVRSETQKASETIWTELCLLRSTQQTIGTIWTWRLFLIRSQFTKWFRHDAFVDQKHTRTEIIWKCEIWDWKRSLKARQHAAYFGLALKAFGHMNNVLVWGQTQKEHRHRSNNWAFVRSENKKT